MNNVRRVLYDGAWRVLSRAAIMQILTCFGEEAPSVWRDLEQYSSMSAAGWVNFFLQYHRHSWGSRVGRGYDVPLPCYLLPTLTYLLLCDLVSCVRYMITCRYKVHRDTKDYRDHRDYRNYLTARTGSLTGEKKRYRREITVFTG